MNKCSKIPATAPRHARAEAFCARFRATARKSGGGTPFHSRKHARRGREREEITILTTLTGEKHFTSLLQGKHNFHTKTLNSMRKILLLFSLVLFASFRLSAQNQRVSGTVTGPDGSPMAGVLIGVQGTTGGAITEQNGTYFVSAPANGTLSFSLFGMVSQSIPVSGRTVINVQLEADSQTIDDVIVVAYGTVKKSSLTGSVATVNATELKKVNTSSFEKALQGISPGVSVSSVSGQPGSAAHVRIRGVGSLNASSSPLYVIDGIAVETENISQVAHEGNYGTTTNPLSAINTNDIESITILKDASAAALYGSRAANGVIVVTTKKGTQGSAKVNFRAQVGVSALPTNGYDLMNAEQHYGHYFKGYLASNGGNVAAANASTQAVYGRNPYNVAEPFDISGKLVSDARLMIDTDWMDELFRTGVSQEYDLSVSGGNDRNQYYMSMGYFDQDGIAVGSGFERFSGRTNLSSKITDWFAAGVNATYAKSVQETPPGGGGGASPLTNSLFLPNAVPVYDLDEKFQKQYDSEGNVMFNFANPIFPDMNAVYLKDQDIYDTKTNRMMVSPYVDISPISGLNWITTFSYDYTNMDETRWYSREHGNGASVDGRLSRYAINNTVSTLSSTANYNFTIANNHNFSAMAGYEAMNKVFGRVHAQSIGFPPGGLVELGLGSTKAETTSVTDKETMLSYFGRLRYDYLDKLYLEGSIRTDGSSRFAPGHRWGTFWSMSAGWRISREDFMASTSGWLDDLKLRTSYGTSGNNKLTQLYGWQGLYGGGYAYNHNSAVIHTQLSNTDLGWEMANNINVGVDFAMFGRLSGSVEYFIRNSDKLLLGRPLALSTGLDEILSNLGGMKNAGIEIDLHSTNVKTHNFSWRTDFNISHSVNKVTQYPQNEDIKSPFIWTEGYSRYEFYIQGWAGVDKETGAPLWYYHETDDNGNLIGERKTTSQYSQATRYKQGSALPKFYGGMNNTLTFKNVDFSFLLGYSFGGKIYDGYEAYFLNDGNHSGYQMVVEALDSWTPENKNAKYPIFTPGNSSNSHQMSSRFLYNADFIKLRSVNIGYNLPQRWASAVKMGNIRVFASAENLFVWNLDKDFKGYDVELGGISGYMNGGGTIPSPRSFQIGLNLSF